MGLLLDQTGSGSGSSDLGRYLPADPIDATREITGLTSSRLLPEGRRCLYVRLHDVSERMCLWAFLSSSWLYIFPLSSSSFVFMALIEYLAVNIVLGDSPDPNAVPTFPERSKMEKLYDLTMRSRRSMSSTVR